MRTVKMKCSSLKLDPVNARTHDKRNVEAIKASLDKFGQQKPIVVDADGVVRAGNGTLIAARELGWETIACVRTELADAEALAYAIADNRTAELAAWDAEALVAAMASIKDPEVRGAVGFTDREMEMLVASTGTTAGQDVVPDPPTEPVAKLGDVWTLGKHRVVCGDCREVPLGTEHDAVFTDPPYGVSYVGKTRDALRIQNDEHVTEMVRRVFERTIEACRPGAVWYVCAPPGPDTRSFLDVLVELGVCRQIVVWVKDVFVMGRSDFHYQHEFLLYGWKPGGKRVKPTDRKQSTVWEVPRPKASREHPTMKPVELVARALRFSTQPGSMVLDPFLGSGTTLIACEQLDRVCYGIEIEPRYVDVVVERWQNLTGKKAKRKRVQES
jgi:DNA modification methylase